MQVYNLNNIFKKVIEISKIFGEKEREGRKEEREGRERERERERERVVL